MIQIDMPMPTNCLECPMCNEYLMCAIPVDGRKWGENDVCEFDQGRPEWCPMKEQEAVAPLTIDDAVSEIMDKHYKRLKEQDYRKWLMDMFHKYERDDLIALLVQYGEENLLKTVLKEQEADKPKGHWMPYEPDKRGYTDGFTCSRCERVILSDHLNQNRRG